MFGQARFALFHFKGILGANEMIKPLDCHPGNFLTI